MVARYTVGEIEDLRASLDGALRGTAKPVWLTSDPLTSEIPDHICVGLRTSGSTARPRTVLFDAAPLQALTAWIHGSFDPVWISALPFTGIGGLNVLVRSLATTHEPIIARSLIDDVPFSDEVFADAVAQANGRVIFTSLVPTQLHRLRNSEAGREALAACTRVFVGGAALDRSLTNDRIVSTYGMTETSGGCVFNGVPAPGVGINIVEPDAEGAGKIAISGCTIAWGYLDGESFSPPTGERVFISHDRGRLQAGLEVLGRLDDVVQVKGVNVSVSAVQSDVESLGVTIIAVPHEHDGSRIVAVTETEIPEDFWTAACAVIRTNKGDTAVPRALIVMNPLPTTHSGKVDVRSIAQQLREDMQ